MLRTQPSDRFGVGTELQLGDAGEHDPPERESIARRETECLSDMGLGFRAATNNTCQADETVRDGQISVQRQRPLAFGDALSRSVRKIWTKPKIM